MSTNAIVNRNTKHNINANIYFRTHANTRINNPTYLHGHTGI